MQIDPDELAQALGRPVTTYSVEPVEPTLRLHSVTGGVYRVTAEDTSLIIKVIRNGTDPDPHALWVSGDDESHRNYWKREWLAYRSGLLDGLPGELRAPRTLLCTEAGDGECWIWMEDVEGRPGSEWAVDDYDSAAFDLATTQAAYPNGRSMLPPDPWLAHGWLRSWVESLGRRIGSLDDDALWLEPAVAPLSRLRARVRALWGARAELLDIVESAPQTVVHGDLWPTNLIAADDGTTVAIDWSQVGIGAVGQDLDQLTLDPVWMQVLPDTSLDSLEAHVVPSYLSGLRLAGLDVDEADLRRWYAAAAGIHYAPFLSTQATLANDPEAIAALEQRHAMPYPVIAANKARVVERALELGESVLDTG